MKDKWLGALNVQIFVKELKEYSYQQDRATIELKM